MLISGGGTTLRNLLEKIAAGRLDGEIALVVSSNADAGGLEIRQRQPASPRVSSSAKAFATPEAYSEAVFDACRARERRLGRDGRLSEARADPGRFR